MGDETVAARLRKLEDERDVVRNFYLYGHALDYGPKPRSWTCLPSMARGRA